MAKERNYVKDLDAVKLLNHELKESAKTLRKLDGTAEDLGKSVLGIAKGLGKSRKETEENVNLAKQQANLGQKMVKFLKAEEKGGKMGVMFAKARLKLAFAQADKNDDITKELKTQYNLHRTTVKIEKHRKQLQERKKDLAKATSSAFGEMGSILTSAVSNPLTFIITLMMRYNAITQRIGDSFGAIGMHQHKQDLTEIQAKAEEFGLSMEVGVESVIALGDAFGYGTQKATELADDVLNIQKSLGLSNDVSANLVGYFSEMTGKSGQQTQELLKQTAALADANNVAPKAVMEDIANSTEAFAKFANGSAEGLLRAAIQARKLGISLDKVAGSAEGMLDFQTSLNAEVEASVMLGRNINLQKARELALTGDLEGFQKELMNAIGDETEYNKLNILQKNSLARALNLSVADMDKMVRKEKEAVTLAGVMAKTDISHIMPKDAMTDMAQRMAEFQVQLTKVAVEIGPMLLDLFAGENGLAKHLITIVAAVAEFIVGLNNSIGIVPLLIGYMATLAGKSIGVLVAAAGTAYVKGASTPPSPVTLALLAAAPVAIAAIVGGITTLISSMSMAGDAFVGRGRGPMISPREGGLIQGTVNDEVLMAPNIGGLFNATQGGGSGNQQQYMEQVKTNQRLGQLIASMDSYFGTGGTQSRALKRISEVEADKGFL